MDIDDIFQVNWDPDPAGRTVKIQAEDVEAMLESAEYLSSMMTGTFRWNLGFNCGWYEVSYGPPPYDDAAGDRAMVANREFFHWFDHLPYHPDVTGYGQAEIEAFLAQSLQWAEEHDVARLLTEYDLTPYHSGIYPIHEPLYDAWNTFGYRYTSTTAVTEGFVHKGIYVAPRQSCGISSSQYSWEQVSQESIDNSIQGGDLFCRVFNNPVLIFMTHQSNFARDRIGLYLFERLVEFFKTWTSYEFVTGPNDMLVEKYFDLFHVKHTEDTINASVAAGQMLASKLER